jgi:atypical dual specificity phosphatase
MLARLIARIFYYPTLALNVLMGRWLKIRNWWDPVDPHCILGAVPLGNDPQLLKDLGVTGVVNMCEEYPGPVQIYQRLGIEQLWLPTTDFQHPSDEMVQQGAEFIQRHKQQGGRVYVHCKAGRARSATIVLWWLVRFGGMTPKQAQQHLLQARPHVHPIVYRRPVIRRLYEQLKQPS